MSKTKFLSVASLSLLAPFAMAQSAAPTTAAELAQSVDMADAQAAGLIIVGLLIGVGVVMWGARMVMAKFAAKV